MKIVKPLIALLLLATVFFSCKKEKTSGDSANMKIIEKALDSFANTLKTAPPAQAALGSMIRSYLLAHPTVFYGSTVTLLDTGGKAIYSPYFYRHNGGIDSVSLMEPAYKIDSQGWLREPIDAGVAVWTEPYFDSGGGNIWMRTRSVPIFISGKIYAVATTDLQVNKP